MNERGLSAIRFADSPLIVYSGIGAPENSLILQISPIVATMTALMVCSLFSA